MPSTGTRDRPARSRGPGTRHTPRRQSGRSASPEVRSPPWVGRQRFDRSGHWHEVVEERAGVGNVESVVATGAAAELARTEAGVGDEVAPLEHGPTGVAEAGP